MEHSRSGRIFGLSGALLTKLSMGAAIGAVMFGGFALMQFGGFALAQIGDPFENSGNDPWSLTAVDPVEVVNIETGRNPLIGPNVAPSALPEARMTQLSALGGDETGALKPFPPEGVAYWVPKPENAQRLIFVAARNNAPEQIGQSLLLAAAGETSPIDQDVVSGLAIFSSTAIQAVDLSDLESVPVGDMLDRLARHDAPATIDQSKLVAPLSVVPFPVSVAHRPLLPVVPASVINVTPARSVSGDPMVHDLVGGSWPRRLDQVNVRDGVIAYAAARAGGKTLFLSDWVQTLEAPGGRIVIKQSAP